MSDSTEQVHSQLSSILSAHGMIRQDAKLVLQPYATQMPRRLERRRQHFRAETSGRVICHVVVGPCLGDEHRLAQGFYQACPELICRPLFFHEQPDGLSFLCLEHFEGVSLDEAVTSGRCDASQWLATVRGALARLQKTDRPSTERELQREIAGLVARTESFAGFSPLDRTLLKNLVEPALRPREGDSPPSVRWSNGDFAGRNLLINAAGEIRLIDYEYAAPTHFSATDWLRLVQFSVLPKDLDLQTIPEYQQAAQPGQRVHFWLHQLFQLLRASPNATVQEHIRQVLSQLLEAVAVTGAQAVGSTVPSILIDSLVGQKVEAEAQIAERTTWAQSLEKDLQAVKAEFARLAKEYAERTDWSRSLEAELQAAKADFALLEKQHAERTAWAKSLEQELQIAKTSFAHLAQEHAERTTWAQSLETELQVAKERFVRLTQEQAQLEVRALALKRELLEQAARLRTLEGVRIETRELADAHAAEVIRLQGELDHAQLWLDHLLLQIANQRPDIPASETPRPPGSP